MEFDMTTIGEAVASLKTAAEVFKTVKGLFGTSAASKEAEEKISEMQRVIFSAYQSALAAQVSQFSMLENVRKLEEKIAKFETWDREKTRYELIDVNPSYGSVFVRALKRDTPGGEPFHVICAKCFEHRMKSILQSTREMRMQQRIHICHECKSEYVYGPIEQRARPGQAITEYDIFKDT
jgi:hypothetical protein